MTDKIKITKQEIEDIYDIEEKVDETPKDVEDKPELEFLTEEETQIDDQLEQTLNWNEEEEK